MGTTSARLLGGRYRLVNLLGRGGMAAVWAGIDTRLDRPVAVKVLDATADPAMLQRLDHEARTLARLAHPNIVAVYDLGTDDGVPYVVMELVQGEDLRQRLAHGPLEVVEAVRIAIQICAALEAAHDSGVIHRDIKPDNVLLTEAGVVKVCDFGIARLQRSTQSGSTRSATAIGTAMYMAPEQATGAPVDARSDLYAVGCVLYAMLAGRPPFTGEDPMRVLWQQVHETPAPIGARRPDVPRDLGALGAELLAKDPAHRPARAGLVRDRLAQLADSPAVAGVGPVAAGMAAGPHGRATVRPRTMVMPAVVEVGQHRPSQRFRLGPIGVGAVAIGVAIVTALVVLLLMMVVQPTAQTGPPGAATSNSAAGSPTASATAATASTDDVRAVIQAQAVAGQLDGDAAKDLLNRLDDIDRDLTRGRTSRAGQRIEDMRDRVGELANDGKITDAGAAAIRQSLDQLASGLPTRGED